MSVDCNRLFRSPELILRTSLWTWSWEESTSLAVGKLGCGARTQRFLEVTDWHLLAGARQEAWPTSQLKGRRNKLPQPVNLQGFSSRQRQTPWPRVSAPLVTRGAPQ